MNIFLIIGAITALIDVVAVGAIMKNSSRISRAEETARLKMRFKEDLQWKK